MNSEWLKKSGEMKIATESKRKSFIHFFWLFYLITPNYDPFYVARIFSIHSSFFLFAGKFLILANFAFTNFPTEQKYSKV